MKKILEVREPNVYARFVGAQELHPLISVMHVQSANGSHPSWLSADDRVRSKTPTNFKEQ